ncbi:Uncharacterized protein ALO57_01061 [Pseudomonas coronafaciens pv. oryzae]|uniref:hypothetical protein n=1 Tax=Pseudomonas coronafaciens TaxID=53409 RepID=UPI0006B695DE|nr:hypothetical protein [Pseudomonas coronafaciens]KPY05662.1 Uncharacterized protein ALO57_01061 [Pseudomonas coronafaciens pv. oryzae]
MLLPYINPRLPLSKSHAAIVIGRLVQAVAHTDSPAYCVTLDAVGDEQVTLTSLSQFCQNVPRINEAYADHCDDEHQDVFWMAYREIGLEDSPLGLICMNSMETGYLSTAHAMNALVDRIRLRISCQEVDEVTEQDEMIAGPTQRRAMHR